MPMILGAKVDVDATRIERRIGAGSPAFGYRKLEPSVMMTMLSKLTREQQFNAEKGQSVDNYINSLLSSLEPVAPKVGGNYAYGPFVFTNGNSLTPNECQKHAADELSHRLRENLRNRYSSYG